MGQRYEPAPNTQHPAQKNRVFDPILYRHFFQSIEADFEKVFERRLGYLEMQEKKLSSNDVFNLTTEEQKRLHKQVEALRWELDTLCAHHDLLKNLIDKSIDAQARLSADYFDMMQQRDQYRTYFENLCHTYHLETSLQSANLQPARTI